MTRFHQDPKSPIQELPNAFTEPVTPKDVSPLASNFDTWFLEAKQYRGHSPCKDAATAALEPSLRPSASNKKARPDSILSINSEQSVNLDDLIEANYTSDLEQETDLSTLANIDLNESLNTLENTPPTSDSTAPSKEVDGGSPRLSPNQRPIRYGLDPIEKGDSYNDAMDDLKEFEDFLNTAQQINLDNWDFLPKGDTADILSFPMPPTDTHPVHLRRNRSRCSSISSEHSLASHSTVTSYHSRHISPTPSTSSSTRSFSRLAQYASLSETSHRVSSISSHRSLGSISQTLRPSTSMSASRPSTRYENWLNSSTSKLAKRASHIPMPASTRSTNLVTPQRTSSAAASTTAPHPSRSESRLGGYRTSQRASHIPSIRLKLPHPSPPSSSKSTSSLRSSSRMGHSRSSSSHLQQYFTTERSPSRQSSSSVSTPTYPRAPSRLSSVYNQLR
ncbi:uncharacterized protein BYT42DRAFT_582303 [Radiomyces spectabilis]|uniref:uncharacterized protein n=1 Tax=Radiomyces spectabilis TaxID=64574 RepID=UPI00222112F7|nr:uncharacterized protein BYT42DRAFT_582303 [Radiomyces spectabilis]KAI8370413.1 hypothetical protein BYT42DRAFT_582303 [Radiomyces spectabilis]